MDFYLDWTWTLAIAGCLAGCASQDDSTPVDTGDVSEVDPRQCGPDVTADASDDLACRGADAEQIGDATRRSEEIRNLVLDETRQHLHVLVGQYACGAAPVYRGRATWESNFPWVSRIDGPVIATVIDEASFYGFDGDQRGPHLVVSSETDDVHAFVRASGDQPGVMEVSPPDDAPQANGYVATCSACTPGLGDPPGRLELDFSAADELSLETAVEVSATLERIDATEVTWGDLVSLGGFRLDDWGEVMPGFQACGDLQVREFQDRFLEIAPQHPDGPPGCFYSADYSARWWVDASNLARHGVSDVQVSEITYCCGLGEGQSTQCFPIDPE